MIRKAFHKLVYFIASKVNPHAVMCCYKCQSKWNPRAFTECPMCNSHKFKYVYNNETGRYDSVEIPDSDLEKINWEK